MPTPPERPLNSTESYAPAAPAGAAIQVPGYEIQGELGRGGMGVVYLAKNVLMNRPEVLKVANRAMLERQPGAAERFLREIRAAAKLNHENVVKAYSAVQVGDLLVFAMEYVEGEDLAKLVRRQGPLTVAQACHYISQAALGLQHAHEQGMVHRDVKPHNLILSRQGKKHVVKVLDFGLAKAVREGEAVRELTVHGTMLGTPDYMAPEQAQDAAGADVRADIYSLGCTLYFLLTGAPPFTGNNLYAILHAHMTAEAPPLTQLRAEAPVELAAVAANMMAKDPAQRYQEPIDAARALAPFLMLVAPTAEAAPPNPTADSDRAAALKATKPLPIPHLIGNHPTLPPAGTDAPERRPCQDSEIETIVAPLPRSPVPTPPAVDKPASRRSALGAGFALLGVVVTVVFLAACADGFYLSFLSPTPPNTGSMVGARPSPLDCTGENGMSAAEVRNAQEAWANYLGRKAEEEDEIAPGVKMKFVLAPPGKFHMGSPEGESDRGKDEVQHEVELMLPFYLGVYDVTRGQFRCFVEDALYKTEAETDGKGGYVWDENKGTWVQNPKYSWRDPGFAQTDDDPVVNVSWNDAVKFCDWLSSKDADGRVYRLPSEAEWEYACRAGRPSSLPFGIGDGASLSFHDANFNSNYPYGGVDKGPYLKKTTPTGTFKANALGLYDMHGNVWQWCSDWHGNYPPGRAVDPTGPSQDSSRVNRGGGWNCGAGRCCAAVRDWDEPGSRCSNLGFRLARIPSGLDK